MSHGLIGSIRSKGPAPRDVIVVTVDQRNHGPRKTKKDTLSYNKNPWRLVAMTATLTGGMQDQQLIMDYLEDYAFPMGGRKIVEFMVTGVSLGGHVVWRLMQSEYEGEVAARQQAASVGFDWIAEQSCGVVPGTEQASDVDHVGTGLHRYAGSAAHSHAHSVASIGPTTPIVLASPDNSSSLPRAPHFRSLVVPFTGLPAPFVYPRPSTARVHAMRFECECWAALV